MSPSLEVSSWVWMPSYKQKNPGGCLFRVDEGPGDVRSSCMERFLRVYEIYVSVQGEGGHVGLPCVFLRTAGCDLRCTWCDTPGALTGSSGRWHGRDELLAAIPTGPRLVQITGGEPLLQKSAVIELMQVLLAAQPARKILLETGGHISLDGLPAAVHVVMDIKLPGSGEAQHDFVMNLPHLKPTDEIKFVIADRGDFERAERWVRNYQLDRAHQVLLSPVWGALEPSTLVEWLLESGMEARLQAQLHKYIWGAEAQSV